MNRRELLAGLGITSASTLLWAMGCGGPQRAATSRRDEVETGSGEVRTWLRDAVARLSAAFPAVHALAVTRRHTTAALDVLGTGVARGRRDGVVLVVRDRQGMWREQASSDLSEPGITAAVRALVDKSIKPVQLAPLPIPPSSAAARITDRELRNRVERLAAMDKLDSRVVYSAAIIDLEDATVWSISPGHDREQRLVRIRERVIRAAWSGARPVASEAERAWIGNLGDAGLDEIAIKRATRRALELMTPGTVEDVERTVILEPTVVAMLVDAGTRALLTSAAARRPEVRRGLVAGAKVASPLITLVDDPTTRGAYGGFVFDDEGELAAPITLLDAGKLAGTLSDRAGGGRGRGRRAGHVGTVEPSPSHLRLAPGKATYADLRDDGFILEGGRSAVVDPSTTRVVISAARGREIKGGKETGRVYADVELVGDLAVLLAAVSGVSSDTARISYREDRDGEPRWRSVDAPWLRTKGVMRGRRST